MNPATRNAVRSLLKNFTKKNLKTYNVEVLKKQYPFHRLFFDEAGLIAFKQERTMVTNMGKQLYPQIALAIAAEKYKDVAIEKRIAGMASPTAENVINSIVSDLRRRKRIPDHEKELKEIKRAAAPVTERKEIDLIADIYIGDFPGGPFFAEIKSPRPNLDVCAESKWKILVFKTILEGKNPKGYLAFAYNPFLTRSAYKHNFTKQVMDMEKEILMGVEFWDYIGGSGTYEVLLEVIEDVGQELLTEQQASDATQDKLF